MTNAAKPVFALLATIAVGLLSIAPASAESSYWEKRWRSPESTPEYGSTAKRRAVKRETGSSRRMRLRLEDERAARGDAVPNPFRVEQDDGRAHPTMNNDYWLQSSIYDFHAGKAADIKQYRY